MHDRGKSDPGYEADSLTCVAGCRPVHCRSEREGMSLMTGTLKLSSQTDPEQTLCSVGGGEKGRWEGE